MTELSSKKILLIVKLAIKTAPSVAEEFGDGYSGGYLYVGDQTAKMLVHMQLGSPAQNKADLYLEYSQEKATRLAGFKSDDLSWQSRCPKVNRWGGAVRLSKKQGFLSFSGFPELVDEAFCLALAVNAGLMSADTAYALTQVNSNSGLTEKMIALVTLRA